MAYKRGKARWRKRELEACNIHDCTTAKIEEHPYSDGTCWYHRNVEQIFDSLKNAKDYHEELSDCIAKLRDKYGPKYDD
jgi:hypothetical protein